MPVDPILTPFLPTPTMPADIDWPSYRAQGAMAAAAMLGFVAQPAPEGVQRHVVTVPIEGGAITAVVHRRAYLEPGAAPLPLHVYLHGSGFTAGSAMDAYVELTAAERVVGAECVVLTVEYRKAPEHPFPSALRDSRAALEWALAHAGDLGIDPSVVTVGGASSGANLAAALCLQLRDEGGPAVALQVLEVPTLDLTLGLPSHRDVSLGTEYGLHRVDLERLRALYLGADGQTTDPYVSPLLAPDLGGLPPAYLLSAEFDLLRDDAPAYAARLRAAGVPAVAQVREGHIHASLGFTAVMPSAVAWRDDVLGALRAAHRGELDAWFAARG